MFCLGFRLKGASKNLLSGERLWISEMESRLISLFKKKGNAILSYFAAFVRHGAFHGCSSLPELAKL